MNKFILFLIALVFIGCGKDTYPLLLKIEQLQASKHASIDNNINIHQHFDLLKELLETQIPKGVTIPNNIDCTDFTLNNFEFQRLNIQCENGFFNVCPRGMNNYSDMATDFIRRCEKLRKDQ